jgi:hypothetical protein
MSESADYTPAPQWTGYDFKSARRNYDDHRATSLKAAVDKSVKASSLIPKQLTTNCESPLVIACDVTGSMGEWPAVIFSKLPYLEHEAIEYLGDDCEISFAAVGDVFSDSYPLQVQEFAKGTGLKTALEKLVIEGNGGGQSMESYDVAAVYYAEACEMPNAIRKPIFIFIGDEGIYSFVDSLKVEELTGIKVPSKTGPAKVFGQLREKFAVYAIRKPYGCSSDNPSAQEQQIQKQWGELLGEDHVLSLPDAARVVDVIFGILAKETGKVSYFKKELTDRQLADKDGDKKVNVVLKSLHTLHDGGVSLKKLANPKKDGKSISNSKSVSSKKSISLLDD